MRRMLFILLPLILLLTACSPALAEATTSATLPPTWTPTATATATPTFAPTPTASPTPTFTPTPTPITLPVTNGTPIPDLPYEVITAENVHRLRQIARYGYPRLLDTNPYRLTADGKTLVVGTTLGLEFYDANTQAKTGGFEVEFLRSFDLTPDGQYLLTLAGETLTVWARDGQKVREFNPQAGDAWQLNAAALSPDGSMLAVQRKKTDWQEADKVEVYRVADGSLLDTVRGNGVLFSPDGQYLVTVFDGSVRLYPAAELGQGWEKRLPKQTLPWCGGNERCGLVFAPDGHLAAVIRPSRVDVYQVEGRKLVRQVSGWESDGYALPQVQFADGQMLVTTPPVYDSQGDVKVKAQAIVVDVATGAWLSRSEVEDGFFAYLDGGEVRTFRWQAEGEMPVFWRPAVKAEDGKLIVKEIINGELIECTNQECDRFSAENNLVDQNGSIYTLVCHKTRCDVVRTGVSLASFFAPQDAYISLWVFPSQFGDVAVVEVIVARGASFTVSVAAYRPDGKQANIANGWLNNVLFDGQRKIAFGIYEDGEKAIRVLDVDEWTVRRYEKDEDLLYFSNDTIYVARQSWDEYGPSLQTLNILTKESDYIRVPKWNSANTWTRSGEEVAESADVLSNLFLVSTGGVVYAIDLDKKEFIGQLDLIDPYSNVIMKFSPNGFFLMTRGTDGFIRVWAVVPEGANVR